MDQYIDMAKRRETNGLTGYGHVAPRDLYAAFDAYPIKGKTVLVVGTLNPWIECIAYVYGAKKIYTFVPRCVDGDHFYLHI